MDRVTNEFNRIFVNEEVEYVFQWGQERVHIDKAIHLLQKAKSVGATHLEIFSYDDFPLVRPIKIRKETRKEFKARIDNIKARLEVEKERELSLYYKLKEKYGLD